MYQEDDDRLVHWLMTETLPLWTLIVGSTFRILASHSMQPTVATTDIRKSHRKLTITNTLEALCVCDLSSVATMAVNKHHYQLSS